MPEGLGGRTARNRAGNAANKDCDLGGLSSENGCHERSSGTQDRARKTRRRTERPTKEKGASGRAE